MTGENGLRRADDIGGQELSYAEVKAIASGNPTVLTLAEADAELQRLNLLKKRHIDEQYTARRKVRDLPGVIADLSKRLSHLAADQATLSAEADEMITIGSRSGPRDEMAAALAKQLDAASKLVREPRRIPLGNYQGLTFGLSVHPQFPPDAYLEGEAIRTSMLSRDNHGPRAVFNAVERIAESYGPECARLRQDLSIAESQLRDYKERLGKPFIHEDYLAQLTDLRDRLKVGLSATVPSPSEEGKPSIIEIAESIKTLKASHTIETPIQRPAQRAIGAEEPVTARIRRHHESGPGQSEPTPFQDRLLANSAATERVPA
jgi:hypothetical protein